MPTASEIRSELQADPAGLGYSAHVAARDDTALAAMLNSPSFGATMPKPVAIGQFALAAAGIGLRAKIEAGSLTTDPPAGLCKTLLELITVSPHISVFDPLNGLALMTTLKDAGIITAQDAGIVTAIVTQPASRAENLWGVGAAVSVDQVSDALNGA